MLYFQPRQISIPQEDMRRMPSRRSHPISSPRDKSDARSISPPTATDLAQIAKESQMNVTSWATETAASPQRTPMTQAPTADTTNACPPIELEPIKITREAITITREDLGKMKFQSALSIAIAEKQPGSPSAPRGRMKTLKIFCPLLKSKVPLSVTIGEAQIVFDVIKSIVALIQATLTKEGSTLMLNETPDYYHFRVGESNGSIDDDIPPIDHRELAGRKNFGDTFVLVPLEGAIEVLGASSNKKVVAPPAGRCLEDIRIDVRIGTHSVRTTAPPDILVGDLLSFLAESLRFRGDVRKLVLKAVHNREEVNVDELRDLGFGCGQDKVKLSDRTLRTMKRFNITEFVIIVPSTEPPFEDVVGSTCDNEWTGPALDPLDFLQYREYEVVKINKYGVRQNRVIGIDTERIYNMFQHGGRGQRTKNPERNISEILEIREFSDKPKYFEVEYTKTSRYDRDQIECDTARVCQEMVRKLRYLRSELHLPPNPNASMSGLSGIPNPLTPVGRMSVAAGNTANKVVGNVGNAITEASGKFFEGFKSVFSKSDKK